MTPEATPAGGRARPVLWALPGGGLLAALLGPLLVPGQVLTEGDLPFFHLPLRHALSRLVAGGWAPVWNPWVHGGQPILSNPNYAAFYPPTWLALASPAYSLQLLLVGHGILAFAGAWRFARSLGASPASAALASAGYAASPWYLSLGDTLNFYCGMAWLPWTLLWGSRALDTASSLVRRRAAVLCGATLALELLAGEPVAALVGALSFVAIAIWSPGRLALRGRVVAVVGLCALGLSAVQLAPTALRLVGSPRGEGIAAGESAVWSARPGRLVEVVAPRLWGDPQRDEEGLYFGWRLHDQEYPYVESLFFGLPLVLLAVPGLFWSGLPRRGAWVAMIAVGLLLGLGRHGPVDPWAAGVPPLSWIRYPEKFLLLAVAGFVFAGALACDGLLRDGAARSRRLLAVSWVAGAVFVVVLAGAALWARSGAVDGFLQTHGGLAAASPTLPAARAFVRREMALVSAAALAVLLATFYARRRPASLPLALVGITLLQLAYYGQGSHPTLPAREILEPPALAGSILADPGRVATDVGLESREEIHPRIGPVGFHQVLGRVSRLEPYVGTLWGIHYVLHEDYDRMFTPWNEHALDLLHRAWPDRRPSAAILRAWGVRHLLRVTDPAERARAFLRTGRLPPPATLTTLDPAPLVRSVTAAGTVPREEAWKTLADRSFAIASSESCLGETRQAARSVARADLRAARAGGGWVTLDYEADDAAFLVVAMTFDEGWTARIDGELATPPCPTVLGQIGLLVPAGSHRLELAYRTPGLRAGALTTLLALVVAAWLVRRP